ncbi:MAG: DNA polymerase III subunit gamma/tau [Rickettsiales bacterium]|nr:DNA polymerase III subunit gamma/tau [Rickettsiales bacterium]
MSSYIALARKYRPQIFNELVGQDVLVSTLTNAIKNNRLHHAYILTGIRGVGKTTTARIIAKTINCTDKKDAASACDKCDNCKSITASKHQDVIEIDAASKTGIDDIREIIDAIAYAPVSAQYKIYIIDEVHMLSNSAFNALLKTLEEPPAHVKFIFATTEIKKVPITILSRCQRFDLRRLSEQEIQEHLKNILEKENIKSDNASLEIIAKMSEGSVRDSLSLLDQAIAISDNQDIKKETIETILGLSDKSLPIELFSNLMNGKLEESLKTFENFYSTSSDIDQLITELLETNHKATTLKTIPNYDITGYSDSQKETLHEISKAPLSALTRIWQILNKGKQEISLSSNQKISFEMLLVRICHLIALPDLKEILFDVNKSKNFVEEKKDNIKDNSQDSMVDEILRNFEGAEIIN